MCLQGKKIPDLLFLFTYFLPWCYHIVCPEFRLFKLEIQARITPGGLGACLSSFFLTDTHSVFRDLMEFFNSCHVLFY